MIIRDDILRTLPLEELYSRALLHFHYRHVNILLLMALTQASAMDSMLVDCGALGLLPLLKQKRRCLQRNDADVPGGPRLDYDQEAGSVQDRCGKSGSQVA